MEFTHSGGVVGRSAFYLLVFPGVVLHEGAHYLACLITGTEAEASESRETPSEQAPSGARARSGDETARTHTGQRSI
jgi:hypothetical protein